jgi:beta-lactamase superfamily II metal-dependent hydrolase
LEKSREGEELLTQSLNYRQLLDGDDDRSAENNSSVILLFEPEGKKFLFTSDAGPVALKKAHNIYKLFNLHWLDVPHHGSRYNLSSELIGIFKPKIAYISCDGSKHYPSQAVVEELKKVGCVVYSTASGSKLYRRKIDSRDGYSKAIPL